MDRPENDKYDALIALYRRDGFLTPEQVEATARDASSPLHDAFEWDDTVAARNFRLAQARDLISSYKVKVTRSDSEIVKVRAFVHEPDRGSYAPVEDVIADADRHAAMVGRLKLEYATLGQRARQFDEFAEVVKATDLLTQS